ncbi:GSCOCG00009334001-RA-CDS [Cotesia congregata]|nr:GSCOCG00009334001-RA-CDS [Cotesia congregata]
MMIQHAQCSTNKKCFCQEAYIAVNARACKALLGENCEQDADCYAENSICMDNKCRCKNFFAADPSNSKCQSNALGKQCNELEDCSIILNSVCSSNGICICAPNYFAFSKYLCVPTINSHCSSDKECMSGGFRCVDSKCQCIHGYTAISADRCVKTNSLYSCNETSECSDSWHWNCASNGKCVCHLDNFALNNSTCLPLLNGYCWKDNQCLAENSVCIDYRCGCNPNHVQAASNLCVLHNEN